MPRPIKNTRNRVIPKHSSDVFQLNEDGLVPAPEELSDKFLKDDGTWDSPGGSGAGSPTGTGFTHITSGSQDAAAKLVENSDVHASAGIVESKLALNFPTHTSANDPSAGEKAALAGTAGTPSITNKYLTNSDPRVDVFTTTQDGLVPSPGSISGLFLKDDATWDTPTATLGDGDYGDITVSSSGTVLTIDTDVVTYAKIQNVTTDRLLGRDTAGSGDVEEIAVTGGLEFTGSTSIQRSALTGDVTASAGSGSTTIANDAVTYAKIQNVATDRLLGRDTAGSGDTEEISVGGGLEFTGLTSIQRSALAGDVTASAGSGTTTIANDAVTFAKFQNISTDRLVGRDTTGTGDPEEISVSGGLEFTGSAGIQRSALTGDVTASAGSNTTTIVADAVTTTKIADDAVTFAKIQNITTDRLLGRDTAGSGDTEEITVTGGLEFTGSTGIQRSALTGDVTASAGSGSTTIAADAVTFSKFQNIATDRLVGRDTAGTGDVEEISVSGGLEFTGSAGIQRSALTGDVTASAGSNATTIANSAVTLAKIQDIATDRLLGRDTAGTGVVEQISVGGGIEFTGSTSIQRSALTGDVTASAGSNTTTIANDAVTYAKIQNVTTDRLLGRDTAGSGDTEEISVTGGLEFTGSTSIQRSALTGDVTASAGSNTTTIANDAVTYAKIQNVTTARVLGRTTAGSGDVEELSAGTNVAFTGGQITVSASGIVTSGLSVVPRIAWTDQAIEYMATSASGTNSGSQSLVTNQIRYILHFEEMPAGATYDAINAFSTTGGAGALAHFALYSAHSTTKKPDALLWSFSSNAANGTNVQHTVLFSSGTWTAAGASYKDGSNNLLTTYGMLVWRAELNTVGNVTWRTLNTTNVRNLGVSINTIGDYRGFSESTSTFPATATPVVYTAQIPSLPLRWI